VSEGQRLVDLGGCVVVDDHCHGFRLDELAALDPAGWEDRLTMMGMCFLSSGQTDERLARQVAGLRDGTVFALTARRWLGEYLGAGQKAEDVAAARRAAFSVDPHGYVARLMADQNVAAVIADEGYPQPPVYRAEFQRALGVPVHRVARIEPIIVELQSAECGWTDFESSFEERLEEAAADGHTVGFKSIIAYRTGLDVTDPTAAEAAAAYDVWRAAGWPKDRGAGKTVRDYLLRATLRACRHHDKVMHLHCGGGDPDIVLAHVRPQDVFGLLHDHMDQPIVLIHGGYPWMAEAAYIASILPFVYIDLSEFLSWASMGIDRELEMLLGVVPSAKLLYGSDEASEPEVFWISARMAREALERVLTRSVKHDFLTVLQAEAIGRGVLGENTKKLHGIA
jgi:uncharacterized protein